MKRYKAVIITPAVMQFSLSIASAWTVGCERQEHGFELERFTGIVVRKPKTFWAMLVLSLGPLLIGMGLAPQFFAKSTIYEFVRI